MPGTRIHKEAALGAVFSTVGSSRGREHARCPRRGQPTVKRRPSRESGVTAGSIPNQVGPPPVDGGKPLVSSLD
jgi:hypothetical protein